MDCKSIFPVKRLLGDFVRLDMLTISDALSEIIDCIGTTLNSSNDNYKPYLSICKTAYGLLEYVESVENFTAESKIPDTNMTILDALDYILECISLLEKDHSSSDLSGTLTSIRDIAIGLVNYFDITQTVRGSEGVSKIMKELSELPNSPDFKDLISEVYVDASSLADSSSMVEVSVVPTRNVSIIMNLDLAKDIEHVTSFPCIVDVTHNPSLSVKGGIKVYVRSN